MRALLIAAMLALPAGLFLGGAWVMGAVTGRSAVGEPLNRRWRGYDAEEAALYWAEVERSQGRAGLLRELRFLEVDLLFPFVYGGALAASLLLGWAMTGRHFSPGWCLLPVGIAMLADWVENLLQLGQLNLFRGGAALDELTIGIASAATQVKLALLLVASIAVAVLALRAGVQFRSAGRS